MKHKILRRLEPTAQRARSALEAYKQAALHAAHGELPDSRKERAHMQCQMVELLVMVETQILELHSQLEVARRAG